MVLWQFLILSSNWNLTLLGSFLLFQPKFYTSRSEDGLDFLDSYLEILSLVKCKIFDNLIKSFFSAISSRSKMNSLLCSKFLAWFPNFNLIVFFFQFLLYHCFCLYYKKKCFVWARTFKIIIRKYYFFLDNNNYFPDYMAI
jgi:hypothetical protein